MGSRRVHIIRTRSGLGLREPTPPPPDGGEHVVLTSNAAENLRDGENLDETSNRLTAHGFSQDEQMGNGDRATVVGMEDGKNDNFFNKLPQYTWWDALWTIITVCLYVADTVFDIFVAYKHYTSGRMTYFWLTVIFVAAPALIVSIFSILVYKIVDTSAGRPPIGEFIVRWIFDLLFLAPVLRHLKVFWFGLKSKIALRKRRIDEQKRYYKLMKEHQSDGAMLSLLERYLEATPQLTLQVMILIKHIYKPQPDFNGVVERISCCFSWTSVSWAITNFNHTSRTVRPDTNEISIPGRILQFFWHFGFISFRVWALALFASAYPIAMLCTCAAHWLLMWVILAWQQHQKEAQKLANDPERARKSQEASKMVSGLYRAYRYFLFNIFSFVHIFVSINTLDGPTRLKYISFYSLCFLENCAFIALAFNYHGRFPLEIVCATAVSFILFVVGVIVMFIYYGCFHPTLRFESVSEAWSHLVHGGCTQRAVQRGSDAGRDVIIYNPVVGISSES